MTRERRFIQVDRCARWARVPRGAFAVVVTCLFAVACSSSSDNSTGDASGAGDTGDAGIDSGCALVRSSVGPADLDCDGTSCGSPYVSACCGAAGGPKCAPRRACLPTTCKKKSECIRGEVCCLFDGAKEGTCGPAPCLGRLACVDDVDCDTGQRCVIDGEGAHVCATC